MNAEQIAKYLLEQGVAVETLSELGTGTSAKNGLAIGYGDETIPRLTQGLQKVAESLSGLK